MSKLTAADAAKYWGCQVVDPETSIKGYISAINDGGVYIDYGMGVTFIQFNNYIKLALRPLSKITDEDAIEVAKIIYGDSYNSDRLAYVVQVTQTKDLLKKMSETPLMHLQWKSIIDFLRSRGYDCDNFISQGKAREI